MVDSPQQNMMPLMMLSGMYGPNIYSQFQGRIPMAGYVGAPTDAMGNPIQQQPGTTLNSVPAAAAPNPSQWGYNNDVINAMARNIVPGGDNGPRIGDIVDLRAKNNAMYGMKPTAGPYGMNAATPQNSQAGAGAGAAPGSMNTALGLLANPGPVTTPGATVPQSPVGAGPSVLQSFLANQQGGAGAGNYSSAGFFNTLNRLRGQ